MTRDVDIHATAIVDAHAQLGVGVKVGPYSIIGSGVRIGDGSVIAPHVVIDGETTIGANNRIHPFASIGGPPQDLKYAGETTRLEVGDDNVVREYATMNRGTQAGGGVTRIGSHGMFMAYSHVAHDCVVGDYVVMANGATLAGHVTIQKHAIVGGLVAIHQHCRIGELAILGGGAMVSQDVPPFCVAAGDRARLYGLNVVGLRRRGYARDVITTLREAYRVLFQSGTKRAEAIERLRREHPDSPDVEQMVGFVEASQRGVCR